MSWLFSRALVEDFSQAGYLVGELSARLSDPNIAEPYLSKDKMRGTLTPSPSGMTSVRLTDCRGAGLLTLYLADFPVRPIPAQLEAAQRRMISGRKCGESWQRQLPGTYLPKTSREKQSSKLRKTFVTWVTKPAVFPYPRKTWVQIIHESDIGYVHTPTATANYAAKSMQKHPNCRAFVQAFGAPRPAVHEYLMGWPKGWSALEPLEMDRFQSWLLLHGAS